MSFCGVAAVRNTGGMVLGFYIMQKIKKGDEVMVICGKSKGVRGKVLRVVPKTKRVFVAGVGIVHKHVKPNPNTNTQGGIVEKESSVHVSNVALYNPAMKKSGKVGVKTLEDGRAVRYFKSNGELVEV